MKMGKNFLALTFFLSVLLIAGNLYAAPVFYLSQWYFQGGVYKINNDTHQAEKLLSPPSYSFHGISAFGSDQLLVSQTSSTNGKLYTINKDGTIDTTYTLPVEFAGPHGAIQGMNGDIYYTDYVGASVRTIDVDTGLDSLVNNTPDKRTWGLVQRSDGEFYVSTTNGIRRVSDNVLLDNHGFSCFFSVDAYDNIFRSTGGYGSTGILKIASNNNISTFWSDSSILMYDFIYDGVEDQYYGIGEDSSSIINIYQFTKSGEASVFIDNILGLAEEADMGGYARLTHAGLVVDNTGSTVPLPAALPLFGSGLLTLIWMVKRRKL